MRLILDVVEHRQSIAWEWITPAADHDSSTESWNAWRLMDATWAYGPHNDISPRTRTPTKEIQETSPYETLLQTVK